MTKKQRDIKWKAWLAARPPIIRKLAKKYPPNSVLFNDTLTWYVVGYNEDSSLCCSTTNPRKNYLKAVATIFHVSDLKTIPL